MKRLVILFMVFAFANSAYSQLNQNYGIYSSFEINAGNYYGIDFNLNYIIEKEYSLKIGYNFQIRSPISKPNNLSLGVINLMVLGLANPYDIISTYQAGFGKIFDLNNNKTIRLNFSIGLGFSNVIEPTNWRYIDDGIIDANYEWDKEVRPSICLIINPKIEFIQNSFMGLTISPMVLINKYRTYYGIGAGFMLGSI